jgi:hypothetical protein
VALGLLRFFLVAVFSVEETTRHKNSQLSISAAETTDQGLNCTTSARPCARTDQRGNELPREISKNWKKK